MKRTLFDKYPYYLTLLSTLATAVLMVYSEQPWDEYSAYVEFSDYTLLFLYIAWVVVPYFPLLFILRKPSSYRAAAVFRAIAVSIICLPPLAVIAYTVFIEIDFQASSNFVFLPIYQWIAVIIYIVINAVIENRYNKKRRVSPPQRQENQSLQNSLPSSTDPDEKDESSLNF